MNAKQNQRRKWVTGFAYGAIGADKKLHVGLVMVRGHKNLDFSKNFEGVAPSKLLR